MQMITFTQLRTQPRQLKQAIDDGQTIDLIHRSRVIAEIKPKTEDPKPFDPDKLFQIIKKLNLPQLSLKQRERNYRKHLLEKYGPATVSRH
jgi:hypothetical protein